ncbi:L-lactate permease [Streptomyces sp. DW4-2]|uniref:L-lactate permease n=1 Tax=Streptomyces spirodelae TaxID=2812904 RepID=A0ABS3WTI2_9ACTN|nr:L-lactate permease [Streptomyces spirodelae]
MELTDIIASLVALAAVVLFLRVWRPLGGDQVRADLQRVAGAEGTVTDGSGAGTGHADGGDSGQARRGSGPRTGGPDGSGDSAASGGSADGLSESATTDPATTSGPTTSRDPHTAPAPATTRTTPSPHGTVPAPPRIANSRVLLAFLPYLVVIGVFSVAKLWSPAKDFLSSTDVSIPWPGIDGKVLTPGGDVSTTTQYVLPWLSSPGTLLLVSGVVVAAVYRIRPAVVVREFAATVAKLRWAMLTVASVLALAYVMNLSGLTITMGAWIAGTGAAFAFLSPILGWLGTAVTGSDTSANALFATLQQTAAGKAGLDPALMVAANTSGGVVGKMISPQNLTIAATAVGMLGREAELFRKAIRWSLLLLLVMCVLVFLQSHLLAWMLP